MVSHPAMRYHHLHTDKAAEEGEEAGGGGDDEDVDLDAAFSGSKKKKKSSKKKREGEEGGEAGAGSVYDSKVRACGDPWTRDAPVSLSSPSGLPLIITTSTINNTTGGELLVRGAAAADAGAAAGRGPEQGRLLRPRAHQDAAHHAGTGFILNISNESMDVSCYCHVLVWVGSHTPRVHAPSIITLPLTQRAALLGPFIHVM